MEQATHNDQAPGPRSIPPRRVLHIITRLIAGGAQQNTILSAAAQVRAGHDVHIAYGPIYGPEGSLLNEARESGATLHLVQPMRRAITPWRDLQCYAALRKLIRNLKPDIVHTHSSKAGIIGRAAAWQQRVPGVIHTIHGLPFHESQPRLVHAAYVRAERWAARHCHAIIGITQAMVDAFALNRIGQPQQFSVVPSGVEAERFLRQHDREASRSRVRAELGIEPDEPVVGIVARLARLKGQDDLLDTLPQLLERHPRLRLLMVGDGWHRDYLEARIAREGHSQRVILTGLVPLERVMQLLTAMDVMALPSYQEGQSRTLIEALLCGTPIVGYNVGGIPAVCIDKTTGLLVPLADRRKLAQAILWMLDHPDEAQAMARAGRAHVQAHFSSDAMVQLIQKVYDQVLGIAPAAQQASDAPDTTHAAADPPQADLPPPSQHTRHTQR